MIDIETLGVTPDSTILTIAAQGFDPHGTGHFDAHSFYARVNIESQPNRKVDDDTVAWWANQPAASQEEAFGEADREPITDVLNNLSKIVRKANLVWINGVGFDTVILEHAYLENGIARPWNPFKIRDCRTVYSLYPDLPKPPTSHHALEDCKRQIKMLQDTLKHLNIKEVR